MKRLLKILWAHIRCDTYLLFGGGMLRGECKLQTWDNQNRLVLIATMTGSLEWPLPTEQIKRTFFIA